MDLRLFSTFYPPIRAEAFAAWPEHMRREFALLTAEAGYADASVRKQTGITPEVLGRARETDRLFALSYKDVNPLDEAEEHRRAVRREWKEKRRGSDA